MRSFAFADLVVRPAISLGLLSNELQSLVDRQPAFLATNADGHHLTRVVTEEISCTSMGESS